MVSLLSSRLSQPDRWQYLRHIPLYCSTALQHSHCHIQLHRVSLLEYPALFVFEYTFSPNPIVVFSFGTLWFSSIWCRSWQLVSVVSVNICPRQCLHILHTVSESMFHKYVFQLMSSPFSWCLPCVQSSFRLPEPCVGDNQSISFTKVNKYLTSVILCTHILYKLILALFASIIRLFQKFA